MPFLTLFLSSSLLHNTKVTECSSPSGGQGKGIMGSIIIFWFKRTAEEHCVVISLGILVEVVITQTCTCGRLT